MDTAKERLREAHRAKILMSRIDDWARANELDRYLNALEAAIDAMTTAEERSAARQWLVWARDHLRTLDPLKRPLYMPEDPKPTAENLKPYLGGWSFYGPHDRCWP